MVEQDSVVNVIILYNVDNTCAAPASVLPEGVANKRIGDLRIARLVIVVVLITCSVTVDVSVYG